MSCSMTELSLMQLCMSFLYKCMHECYASELNYKIKVLVHTCNYTLFLSDSTTIVYECLTPVMTVCMHIIKYLYDYLHG